jgi:uncharacterized membrane protein YdbT with pleckstrin-like domain
MGFVNSNLMPDESVLYRANFHWMIFFWPAFFLMCAIFDYSSSKDAGNIFLMIAVLTGVYSLIVFKTSEFAVTNKRVLAKFGAIRRTSLDILLPKVESVLANQGILGRILNYGTIVVRGSGGTANLFPKISKPLELRNQVQIAISKL